jgi:hypothetical protein
LLSVVVNEEAPFDLENQWHPNGSPNEAQQSFFLQGVSISILSQINL